MSCSIHGIITEPLSELQDDEVDLIMISPAQQASVD